ncbi:MAG: transcriptional regulator NrdR [Patescibacteria group bacterium]|nr:transcriptional regulator NrdR [Patescibacteria group bacterium]
MKCPYCLSTQTAVVDSRDSEDFETIRRRRECLRCSKRFTTYERIEMVDLTVVKKDGRREQFDRGKLLAGIVRACEKRPISLEMINKMVTDIEKDLRGRDGTEVSSREVGELVMKKLRSLDKVAYIRFASVYREFEDIESFEKEIKRLG